MSVTPVDNVGTLATVDFLQIIQEHFRFNLLCHQFHIWHCFKHTVCHLIKVDIQTSEKLKVSCD